MRGFTLFVGALLLVGLSPLRASASCPNYFFGGDPNKCNADGFCGWFDMRAVVIADEVDSDDPGPMFATFADPWADSADAVAGRADASGIAAADFDAARGFVAASGDARSEGPCCDSRPSVVAEGRALAVMRVADLVFSGPGEEVEASLRLTFDADLEEVATNLQDDFSTSSMLARTNVYLGGGLCQGFNDYFDFVGYHLRTLLDQSEGGAFLVENSYFLLGQVPLGGESELVAGPFTVPTDEPLTFELWIETIVTTSGNGGFARAAADFSLALGPPGGGEVFDLPLGYTANSPTAGIVANAVPEPAPPVAGLGALGALAALRRRRVACRARSLAGNADGTSRSDPLLPSRP